MRKLFTRASALLSQQSSFFRFSSGINAQDSGFIAPSTIPSDVGSAEISKAAPASARLTELRKSLAEYDAGLRPPQYSFAISPEGRAFLDSVRTSELNKKYSRGGKNGEGYVGVEEVMEQLKQWISDDDYQEILQQSEKIQGRMRVKVSETYLQHAIKVSKGASEPNPLLKIVMPDAREVDDLSGEVDPSNQNRYSPLPGLLHKYEMLLALVSINCSSHCRYCYRLDLFNGTSNKSKADMPIIAAYIKTFNEMIDGAIQSYGKRDEKTGLWFHKETNEPLIPVREILFSGGDPMTLPNATLARYMTLMAEAGVSSIRIGTKEMAFNPSRFDKDFWKVMDRFHETYPDVRLDIVGHYSHPYELVESQLDKDGKYLYDLNLKYRLREDMRESMKDLRQRGDWITHSNQFPIIAGLNDAPEKIRLLSHLCHKFGINMHNIYACREIVGNSHFREDNDIPGQYGLVRAAKAGLSGLENHGRLVMSTEYGKMEIVGADDSEVLLSINRYVNGIQPEETMIRVDLTKLSQGERFYWLTDDVIKRAVDQNGKEILNQLGKEDNSLIKKFKKRAAAMVAWQDPFGSAANDNSEQPPKSAVRLPSKNFVTVRVEDGRNGGFRDLEVDLSLIEGSPTLATILSKYKMVEAACDEQLSCSTCVGDVKSSGDLPPISDDEQDIIDMAQQTYDAPSTSLRATCQIPLKPGMRYEFSSPESLLKRRSNPDISSTSKDGESGKAR